MKDLEKYLRENDIEIFIFTPIIKTGISINKKLFNYVFAFQGSHSCSVKPTLQMYYRERNPDAIFILLEANLRNMSSIIKTTKDDMIAYVHTILMGKLADSNYIIFDKNKVNDINKALLTDKNNMRLGKFHYDNKINNLLEEARKINFANELVAILSSNHKFKVNIFYKQTLGKFIPSGDPLISYAKMNKAEKEDEYINAPTYSRRNMKRIKDSSGNEKRKENDAKFSSGS